MTMNKIPLAGVIGSPIAHSRSPRLHGYWLKHYGIPGYYIPMDIAAKDFAGAMRTLPTLGFRGVNVTIPHKELALRTADRLTERASLIGAVNTLTFGADGLITGDNTDGYGFIRNIRHNCPDWDPGAGPAAILGAGGGAKAVVASLIDAGVPEIRICNRTRARAEALRADLGQKIEVRDWDQADSMLKDAMTVVNTTALGMKGNPPLPLTCSHLSPEALVTDIVYTPLETPLLRAARDRGCRTVDGLGMLIFQAAPGFERWFGCKPEITDELRDIVLA